MLVLLCCPAARPPKQRGDGRPMRAEDSRSELGRRPGTERVSDLPFVADWIGNPTETPAVLVAHGRDLGGASANCLPDELVGICDHEQGPAGRTVDRARAQASH